MDDRQARELLLRLFRAALSAVDPRHLDFPHLPPLPSGRRVVVGAGKAAAAMTQMLARQGSGPMHGLIIVPHGHALAVDGVEVVEAAHPVPDTAGVAASRHILEIVSGLSSSDRLVCLLSGGASSLLCVPADGLSLGAKQAINRSLLRNGVNITGINTVRKHLSAIKGGRLAAASAAPVQTLLVSDVPGDDPSVIGSGPTVPDPTSCADALEVIERFGIELPDFARERLSSRDWESPKPGDDRLAGCTTEILARPRDALDAAVASAREYGLASVDLGDTIEGESREVAKAMAQQIRDLLEPGQARPFVVLSGGETTVTVRGRGRGGRNTEFLLALGIALDGQAGIHALACDTDGIDGNGDNAGAVLHPASLSRLADRGLDARALLDDNDAWRAFEALGDLVVTGPTLTNVNDFRAILVT